MSKNISQKVVFKKTTPKAVYDLYMNAKKHSKIAGSPATVSSEPGSAFSTHGGYITGQIIEVVKNQLIVQTWRAQGWKKSDPDSIFTIYLEQKGKNVVLHAIHAMVPDKHADGISKGWHQHYWEPWTQHLAGKPITRVAM